MIDFSIVVTIKNRKEHFLKTFSSLVTQQQPWSYEVNFVDYGSQDDFGESLKKETVRYLDLFSDSLKAINRIVIEDDVKFNSGKAKNIGFHFSSGNFVSFSDADVFLGMDYHRHWIQLLTRNDKYFFSSRVQETTECSSRRVTPKTNYGNMIVTKSSFAAVGGFDENNPTWGGDDDDIIHRLKLYGLREINPHDVYESHHTSIIHNDELRIKFLESMEKNSEISKQKFEAIYNNSCFINPSFLSFYNDNKSLVKVERVYERT
jgi:glycosyltransferase involved in cell wall biosynthesis